MASISRGASRRYDRSGRIGPFPGENDAERRRGRGFTAQVVKVGAPIDGRASGRRATHPVLARIRPIPRHAARDHVNLVLSSTVSRENGIIHGSRDEGVVRRGADERSIEGTSGPVPSAKMRSIVPGLIQANGQRRLYHQRWVVNRRREPTPVDFC